MKIKALHLLTIILTAVVACLIILLLGVTGQRSATVQLEKKSDNKSYEKTLLGHADYPSFPSLASLSKEAEAIFVGVHNGETVTEDGKIIENEGVKPFKEAPKTSYTFTVTEVLKGSLHEQDTVKLTREDGIQDGIRYILEGVPHIEKNDVFMIFAIYGTDSAYHALAGNTAIARLENAESYLIPEGVGFTRSEKEVITADDVRQSISSE